MARVNKRGVHIRDWNQPERAWIIDNEIPIFKDDGRQYIDILVGLSILSFIFNKIFVIIFI